MLHGQPPPAIGWGLPASPRRASERRRRVHSVADASPATDGATISPPPMGHSHTAAPPHTASLLVRKLIEHVVDALTSADDATTWPMFAKAGDGVASLPLSPLTAEVADVLALRSAGCSTQLLPAVQAVVATSIKEDGAELNALRGCVRWLLACDSLTRAELPGRRALRLTLEAAHAESQVSSSASALGQLASPLASVVSSLADPRPQAE